MNSNNPNDQPKGWDFPPILRDPHNSLWDVHAYPVSQGEVCVCSLTQLCLTLCDPMDCSPPASSVHGILQARILEWVAMPSSRGSSLPKDQTHISCIGRLTLYHWATREALEDEEKGSKRLIDFSKVTQLETSRTRPVPPLCHPQTLSGPGCGSELSWSLWANPVMSHSFPLHLPLPAHNKAGLANMAESMPLTSTPESDSESPGSVRGGPGTHGSVPLLVWGHRVLVDGQKQPGPDFHLSYMIDTTSSVSLSFPHLSTGAANSPQVSSGVLTSFLLIQKLWPGKVSWLSKGSLVAQTIKNPPAMWETGVQSLNREDPLKKRMATHSSILAWRIP